MMVTELTKTCRWIVIYYKTYFINVHLLVSYQVWNYLSNLPIPESIVLLVKLTVILLLKKFPNLCGIQMFTVIKTLCHWSVPWAKSIYSTLLSYHITVHFKLSSLLCLYSEISFLQVFQTNLCKFFIFLMPGISPAQLILLNLIPLITSGQRVKITKFLTMKFSLSSLISAGSHSAQNSPSHITNYIITQSLLWY